MQTLIYCDIDGILHRWPCPPDQMFDSVCIARLADAIQGHNAELVITSAWRLKWPLKQLQGASNENQEHLAPLSARRYLETVDQFQIRRIRLVTERLQEMGQIIHLVGALGAAQGHEMAALGPARVRGSSGLFIHSVDPGW